jgi:hypothetical protein
MPGAAPFSLVPERVGVTEEVLCVAAGNEIGTQLPAMLQADDLTPMTVQGLDQVDQMLRASARGNLATSRVRITVTN